MIHRLEVIMRVKNILPVVLMLAGAVHFARAEEPDPKSLADANRDFAVALHRQLAVTESGNLFYSPYSISTALAMTYAGARGGTEAQLATALRFPVGAANIAPAFGDLQLAVRSAQRDGLSLWIANSLWPHAAFAFDPAYLHVVAAGFNSEVYPVDYRDADTVRLRINAWVEQATRDKIRDMIPPGALNALTRMVLVNAVYFKGDWASKFPVAATAEQPFFLNKLASIPVSMMHKRLVAGYSETAGLQMLDLPYVGGQLSMTLVLPAPDLSLADLEQTLSSEQLSSWLVLPAREVDVYVPRFSMTSDFSLSQILRAMGVDDAFSAGRADFSGMGGQPGELYIDDVIHKAFVEVNEEGTEAAAATAVTIRATSFREPEPVPVFRADRPFLFFINDRSTGSILFTGRCVNPEG